VSVLDHSLTLIGRSGCHLCDDARAVVESVLTELSEMPGTRLLTEIDIDTEPEARRIYADQIPVLLVDGKVHNFWRIDRDRLISALA
jgi:hypothetical protein